MRWKGMGSDGGVWVWVCMQGGIGFSRTRCSMSEAHRGRVHVWQGRIGWYVERGLVGTGNDNVGR